jgi:hypothetical protein
LILSQELHEELLGDLGKTQRFGFGWNTKRSLAYSIIGDTASVVIFFFIDADSSMPNTLKVLAYQLL